jgi:uncharacterized Zn finger protein
VIRTDIMWPQLQHEEERMRCARCSGFSVPEVISEGGTKAMALRCVLCGDIVDHVIARNRQRRRHPQPSRARTPIYSDARWKQRQPTLI